jgi:hypothetical protein
MAMSGRRCDDRYDSDPYYDERYCDERYYDQRYYDQRGWRSGRPRHTGSRPPAWRGHIA